MKEQRSILIKRSGIALILLLILSSLFAYITAPIYRGQNPFIFTVFFGGLGALISLVKRTPDLTETELLFLTGSRWIIFTKIIMGSVFGTMIYIMFISGILSSDGEGGFITSNLFPKFTNSNTISLGSPVSVKDVGKLIFWSFLSGYSERLAPNILTKISEKDAGK